MNHAQLTALGRALRVLGEHGDALSADTPDAKLHEVKADLKRALDLLEETVTTAVPTTRCAEHPNGPVDEGAVDLCLLCETRRRTARRTEVNDAFPQGRPSGADDAPERTMSPVQQLQAEPPPAPTALAAGGVDRPGVAVVRHPDRRDRVEAERYLAAERRTPRPGMAYRLVHEFTDYEVLRIWGTPVKVDIEPMGNL